MVADVIAGNFANRAHLRLVRSPGEMMADLRAALEPSTAAPRLAHDYRIVELALLKPGVIWALNRRFEPVPDGEPFTHVAMHPDTAEALRMAINQKGVVVKLDDYR